MPRLHGEKDRLALGHRVRRHLAYQRERPLQSTWYWVKSPCSESNFFEADWARSYWGPNYPRLLALKDGWRDAPPQAAGALCNWPSFMIISSASGRWSRLMSASGSPSTSSRSAR